MLSTSIPTLFLAFQPSPSHPYLRFNLHFFHLTYPPPCLLDLQGALQNMPKFKIFSIKLIFLVIDLRYVLFISVYFCFFILFLK